MYTPAQILAKQRQIRQLELRIEFLQEEVKDIRKELYRETLALMNKNFSTARPLGRVE